MKNISHISAERLSPIRYTAFWSSYASKNNNSFRAFTCAFATGLFRRRISFGNRRTAISHRRLS